MMMNKKLLLRPAWILLPVFIIVSSVLGSHLLKITAMGNSGKGSNTIEFMQWWQPEMKKGSFDTIISKFEKANPQIKVKVISLPYSEVQNQVVVGAASGSISDVVGIDGAWINTLVKQEVLEPFDDYIAKTNFKVNDMASVIEMNGKKWMFPVATFVYPVFYNKKMFQDGGIVPPKTRAEFIKAAEKLTNESKGVYGWSLPLSLQNPNGIQNDVLSWAWANGDSMLQNGKPNLETPGIKSVLEFIKTMYDDGSISPGINTKQEQEKVEEFVNNRVAMITDSVAHVNLIRERNKDLDFGIMPLPVTEGFSGKPGLSYAAWGIGITKASKNKDAAWSLLSYIMSPDTNGFIASNANAFPGNKKSSPDFVQTDPIFKQAFEIFQNSNLANEFVGAPNALNLMRKFDEQLQKFLAGQVSVDEAVSNTQVSWKQEYAK